MKWMILTFLGTLLLPGPVPRIMPLVGLAPAVRAAAVSGVALAVAVVAVVAGWLAARSVVVVVAAGFAVLVGLSARVLHATGVGGLVGRGWRGAVDAT